MSEVDYVEVKDVQEEETKVGFLTKAGNAVKKWWKVAAIATVTGIIGYACGSKKTYEDDSENDQNDDLTFIDLDDKTE